MDNDLRDYEITWPGLPIKHLILACDDFIVFLDPDNDIDWKTTDAYDIVRSVLPIDDKTRLNKIKNEISSLESFPTHDLPIKVIVDYKRQLAEALVRTFDFDYDNAERMLLVAKKYIIDRNTDKSRYMYLKASGLITLLVAIIGLIMWLSRVIIVSATGQTVFFVLLAISAGSLGAYLSIIQRIGKANIDYNASKELHYLEASTKIVAGMISALIIALSIKAGILLPIFTKISSTGLAMVLGGLIAGASERLVPSIISKVDGSKLK